MEFGGLSGSWGLGFSLRTSLEGFGSKGRASKLR